MGPRAGLVRKISPLTGIRSLDRPARSQSLYRLSYPAHICSSNEYKSRVRENLKGKPNIVLSRKSADRPALDICSTI